MEGDVWGVTYKEWRAEGDVQSAIFSLPMCTIGYVRMCVCVCVCISIFARVCTREAPSTQDDVDSRV